MKTSKNKIIVSFIFSLFLLGACGGGTPTTSETPTSEEPTSIVPTSVEESSEEEKTSEEETSEEISSEDTSIHVTSVELKYDTITLEVEDTATIGYTILPYDATNQDVTWDIVDQEIATINENGLITALKQGATEISITTVDGDLKDTCLLTVEAKDSGVDYIPNPDDPTILIITDEDADETGLISKSINTDYKQIYVNAPNSEVELSLEGTTISNNENSPIFVKACGSIDISAKKSTENSIIDARPLFEAEESDQGKGAIYVEDGDVTLKGKGKLNITANYLNAVHGKDDVEVKNLTLDITAVNHALRANDNVTIESGKVTISCGGDALHSTNSEISKKGNQKGNVEILGGTVDINCWGDAIDAAYNAVIGSTEVETEPTVTIKTNKYSSYEGEVVDTSDTKFYIRMTSSSYGSGKYTYAAYINETFYTAEFKKVQSTTSQLGGMGPGGRGGSTSTYYIYEIEKPAEATNFTLYRFNEGVTPALTGYNAKSDIKAFNTNYDTVLISVSSSRISFGSWSNYEGAGISSKGIKAANEVYVVLGELDIKAYDDAIHANRDGYLDNGSTPLGNVNIEGGVITLNSSDDAIHADNEVNIKGGEITVSSSYEGIEGNVVNISGGTTYVTAIDDGINATKGINTPAVNVTGGYLDVTVPTSGDTDGIDSNGSYVQSGGVVIVKGPGSASGGMAPAAALDTDGAVTLSGGTLIVFGAIEKTPSTSLTRTICSSQTVSAGDHTITFGETVYTTNLKYSTSSCVVYSELGTAVLA